MLIAGEPVEPEKLIDQAWAVIEPILTVSADEREYLTAIQHGNLRLELLFPDNPEEAARIAAHPAILWKIANLRTHLNRQR